MESPSQSSTIVNVDLHQDSGGHFRRLWVDDKLHFFEEPMEIMDHEVKWLNRSQIPLFKEVNRHEVLGYIGNCGGFPDDLEDDLDWYDGYEAQVYDLTEQEQAFFDCYDIRSNSRCRK
nr:putative reverse transcriptase domain-containing protein [Tanacetum cinerariifolium]